MKLHILKNRATRYDAEHPLAVALAVATLVILVGLFGAQAAASYVQREILVDPAVTDSFLTESTSEQRAQLYRDLAVSLQRIRGRTVEPASVLFTPTRVGTIDCDRPWSLKANWSLGLHFGCDYRSSRGERRTWTGTLRWQDWSTDAERQRPGQCNIEVVLLRTELRAVSVKSCRGY